MKLDVPAAQREKGRSRIAEDISVPRHGSWAAAYKEVGNGLFKQGKHEWALRTYLNGVQQLHRLGYADDPERMFTDVAAWSVCAAGFSTRFRLGTALSFGNRAF